MKKIMLIIFSLCLIGCFEKKEDTVKVGQIWEYKFNNPFVGYEPDINEVINIKDGYVQYKNLTTGRTDSTHTSIFVIGSELKE